MNQVPKSEDSLLLKVGLPTKRFDRFTKSKFLFVYENAADCRKSMENFLKNEYLKE